eukprot:713520-Hanusia_phi.AAC.3
MPVGKEGQGVPGVLDLPRAVTRDAREQGGGGKEEKGRKQGRMRSGSRVDSKSSTPALCRDFMESGSMFRCCVRRAGLVASFWVALELLLLR